MSRDFSHVRRMVVKVGPNLLSSPEGIATRQLEMVVINIVELKERGIQVLLVSSVAIGLGARLRGRATAGERIRLRQACASIGQPLLMSHYRLAFKKHGLVCAQVLLTRSDLNERKTFVNLKNAVETLLDLGVIPIFNENDVVSTAEIGTAFGDNDRMSAYVANKIDADLLVMLTDVDGLYTTNPKKDREGHRIKEIDRIDQSIFDCACEAGSLFASGGMKTKIQAAQIASKAGCATLIASGYEPEILTRIISGEQVGTHLCADRRLSQRTRWILNSSAKGVIHVDQGALQALHNHKSLLPSGVLAVEGVFKAGDVVLINDTAKAVPYYNSVEIEAMAGHQSQEIPDLVEEARSDVIFRPDDIVFLDKE